MESIQFPHFDEHLSQVHIALFRNISNSSAVKARIVAASTAQGEFGEKEREAVNFAFINARLITSRLHLETAIHQAILAASQSGLRTRTVHSEILYNLNPTHNITEAIRRYGISESDTDALVVRIDSPTLRASQVEEMAKAVVAGDLVPLSEFESVTDWASIKKYHKLNNEVAVKEASSDSLRERAIVDNIVVSSVAMKSVMG